MDSEVDEEKHESDVVDEEKHDQDGDGSREDDGDNENDDDDDELHERSRTDVVAVQKERVTWKPPFSLTPQDGIRSLHQRLLHDLFEVAEGLRANNARLNIGLVGFPRSGRASFLQALATALSTHAKVDKDFARVGEPTKGVQWYDMKPLSHLNIRLVDTEPCEHGTNNKHEVLHWTTTLPGGEHEIIDSERYISAFKRLFFGGAREGITLKQLDEMKRGDFKRHRSPELAFHAVITFNELKSVKERANSRSDVRLNVDEILYPIHRAAQDLAHLPLVNVVTKPDMVKNVPTFQTFSDPTIANAVSTFLALGRPTASVLRMYSGTDIHRDLYIEVMALWVLYQAMRDGARYRRLAKPGKKRALFIGPSEACM